MNKSFPFNINIIMKGRKKTFPSSLSEGDSVLGLESLPLSHLLGRDVEGPTRPLPPTGS